MRKGWLIECNKVINIALNPGGIPTNILSIVIHSAVWSNDKKSPDLQEDAPELHAWELFYMPLKNMDEDRYKKVCARQSRPQHRSRLYGQGYRKESRND